MFPGIGTLVNVVTVLLGTVIGVLVGHRLRQRTRDVVTDALGLVTLLIAASAAVAVSDPDLEAAVGSSASDVAPWNAKIAESPTSEPVTTNTGRQLSK